MRVPFPLLRCSSCTRSSTNERTSYFAAAATFCLTQETHHVVANTLYHYKKDKNVDNRRVFLVGRLCMYHTLYDGFPKRLEIRDPSFDARYMYLYQPPFGQSEGGSTTVDTSLIYIYIVNWTATAETARFERVGWVSVNDFAAQS